MDTESVDIKKESTASSLEGTEGKGIILHFNASRKLMLVFSFNFIFLSCLGNIEKLRNGLRIFRPVIFFQVNFGRTQVVLVSLWLINDTCFNFMMWRIDSR